MNRNSILDWLEGNALLARYTARIGILEISWKSQILMLKKQQFCSCLLIINIFMLSGCVTIEGPTEPGDPFESFNRGMYHFNDSVDEYVMEPVAIGYNAVTPLVVQKGVTNFFSNLGDVVVVFNDLLQLKPVQFISDAGRLLINSTLGLYGIIDWATDMGLERHDEDFGQTLGYWGVPRGPYLVMPFFGPSTVRDTGGFYVDSIKFDPIYNEIHEGMPFPDRDKTEWITLTVVDAINTRTRLLLAGRLLSVASLDEYIYLREAYLQKRNNLVHDGNPPKEDWEYYEED